MNDMVDPNSAVITEADINFAVRSTSMLADVTIGTWSAEYSDRDLMDGIKADAGATGDVGRVIKNVLAGADGLLKDARGAYAAVRAKHFSMTLPWVGDPNATRAS